MVKKAFVSWSGGKDCCLACYRAADSGLDVRFLLNMAGEDGMRSRSHGLSKEVLEMQAEAMFLPIIQRKTSWDTYEDEFRKVLMELKEQGIKDGIFGDIDLDEHREWVERVCLSCGITPHLPLWTQNQSALLREFINSGFKAIIVATDAAVMGQEWLGRVVDSSLLADLGNAKNITPCGENGEYHTLVTGGPLFEKELEVVSAEKILRDKHWFLDIKSCKYKDKGV
ncbi:MAG TPA: ATP pyrophosphatase [Dehalococcoidia bacterium]|nr:ATP pyrophosphatase [Dehalococcoidia bacterium]